MSNTTQDLRRMRTRQEWVDFFNHYYYEKHFTCKYIAEKILDTTPRCLRNVLREVGITFKQGKPPDSRKFKGE